MARRRRRHHKMLGSVDLFGLNQFGQNPGLSPIYGALIGGGVSSVASFAAGKTHMAGKQHLIGFAAGAAAAGAMYSMKATRHAAIGALAGAFLASGLPMIFKAVTGGGLGLPQVEYLSGLGVHDISYLNGAGLGIPGIAPLPQTYGNVPGVNGSHGGVAGSQIGAPGSSAPIDLLGAATAQSNQVQLLGGPTISGLSAAYGATLLGGGR